MVQLLDYKVGQRDYKVGQLLGLQSGASWDYKVGQLLDYKVGQKDYKVGQGLQSGAKGLQSGAGITKWGKDYKVVQYKRYKLH